MLFNRTFLDVAKATPAEALNHNIQIQPKPELLKLYFMPSLCIAVDRNGNTKIYTYILKPDTRSMLLFIAQLSTDSLP